MSTQAHGPVFPPPRPFDVPRITSRAHPRVRPVIHAVDQYGDKVALFSAFPRRELMARLGYNPRNGIRKVYRDTADGTKHVGYVLGGRWFTFYVVTPWERDA